ncbi:protein charybde-like [Ctenocephalides felis]|uniref:protein charybde-like n=1 Tax=Ctenocephalides felis TaxID=7515 RepID=UPI000E6E328A|nr:protein charybde-like [Ctenocephalides felis]XP_026472886.1 protein charybde-like [Ctenocephalides felis]
MEVLSVNQFNGQFTFGNGVKGGWSSTAPQHSEETSQEDSLSTNPQSFLARNLARELRSAKQNHLACSEVLLPSDLLHRAASEIVKASECEPCGVRGCTIYVEFEPSSGSNSSANNSNDKKSQKKVIACLRPDESTVSTFELYLTLKQENGWTDRLPQFLKNLTRGGTVVISPDFTLSKTLLYRSYRDS